MKKDKEIKVLNNDEAQSISGGILSDEEANKFFPDSKFKEFMKSSHTTAVCKKCGEEFPRFSGAWGGVMSESERRKHDINQQYCKKCANEEMEKDPIIKLKLK